jgi:flagellar hook-length control protein FliK
MDLAKGVPSDAPASKEGSDFEQILAQEDMGAELKPADQGEISEAVELVEADPVELDVQRQFSAELLSVPMVIEPTLNSQVQMVSQEEKSPVKSPAFFVLPQSVSAIADEISGEVLETSSERSQADLSKLFAQLESQDQVDQLNLEVSEIEGIPQELAVVKEQPKEVMKESEAFLDETFESEGIASKVMQISQGESQSFQSDDSDSGANDFDQALIPKQSTEGTKNVKDFVDQLWMARNMDQVKMDSSSLNSEILDVSGSEKSLPDTKSQILKGMDPLITKVLTHKEGGEMTIQLKPGHLGAMKIDIQVVGESMKVGFEVENPVAQRMIQSQIVDLKNQLQSVGLRVDSLQITTVSTLQSQENPRNGQQQQGQQHEHQQQANHQQQQRSSQDEKPFWMSDLHEEVAA